MLSIISTVALAVRVMSLSLLLASRVRWFSCSCFYLESDIGEGITKEDK